jgi:hypothetical protein
LLRLLAIFFKDVVFLAEIGLCPVADEDSTPTVNRR